MASKHLIPEPMKILCGTDFSPNSNDALAAGAALAFRFGDSLELVHAQESPVDDGTTPEATGPSKSELQGQLEAWAAPLRSAGLGVTTRILPGNPVEVLEELAGELHPRWVVLSSIGRVALIRIVLGSTADRVAERSPAPTLVVRRGLDFSEWHQANRPLRVFVAADATPASDRALALVRDWASVGPVEIRIGHVTAAEHDTAANPGDHPREPSPLPNAELLLPQLRQRFAAILGNTHFDLELIPETSSVSAAIIEAAKAHRAVILVTGTTQTRGLRRLWHRSVSRALLADAPMNVAVVPASVSAAGEAD